MKSHLIRSFFGALVLSAATTSLFAQLGNETVLMNDGSIVSGEILTIADSSLVLGRRMGEGSARQVIDFKKIHPEALYGIIHRALSPLEGADHMRIGDVAYGAGLFDAAARHYKNYGKTIGTPTTELMKKILDAETKDVESILARSRDDLDRELFADARRLALEAMRRYPEHDLTKTIPTYLAEITEAAKVAHERDIALLANKKAKAAWEAGEKELAGITRTLAKAKAAEQDALKATEHFTTSRDHLDNALRHLRSSEGELKGMRQSKKMPLGLRPSLAKLEEETRALEIRIRLHLASLYTLRGSYGTAMNYVNAALAFDPTDAQALAARARIEEASAVSSSRWNGRLRGD